MTFIADHAGRPSPVEFISLPMAAPDDFSALQQRLEADFTRDDVLALFIKTPGNGLDNDWSRKLALHAVTPVLAAPPGGDHEAASLMPPLRMISGGCEGFITPHMVALVARSVPSESSTISDRPATSDDTLVAVRTATAPLAEAAIGTAAHLEAAAAAVHGALKALDVAANQVSYVHAVTPMTGDGHASKPRSRAATALGAALALGELDMASARQALDGKQMTVHGKRCGVTAGDTNGRVDLIVFAHVPVAAARQMQQGSRVATNRQAMLCMSLDDPIDMSAVRQRLAGAVTAAVIYKGDPPADGYLHGELLGMRGDSDLPAFRHFRAAMSGVLASTTQTSRLLIGGGAEHQCPVGGGLLTLVVNNGSSLHGENND